MHARIERSQNEELFIGNELNLLYEVKRRHKKK